MPKRKSPVKSSPSQKGKRPITIPALFQKQNEAQIAQSAILKSTEKSPAVAGDDSDEDVEIIGVQMASSYFSHSKPKRPDRSRLSLSRKPRLDEVVLHDECSTSNGLTSPKDKTEAIIMLPNDPRQSEENQAQSGRRRLSGRLSLRKRQSDNLHSLGSEQAGTVKKSVSEPPPNKLAKMSHSAMSMENPNDMHRKQYPGKSNPLTSPKVTRKSPRLQRNIKADMDVCIIQDDSTDCTELEAMELRVSDPTSSSSACSSTESMTSGSSSGASPSSSSSKGRVDRSEAQSQTPSHLTPRKKSSSRTQQPQTQSSPKLSPKVSKNQKTKESKAPTPKKGRSFSWRRKVPAKSSDDSVSSTPTPTTDREADEKEEPQWTTPYYLENFLFILKAVTEDSANSELFDEHDQKVISKFSRLSEKAQKLFVRLFSRKLAWLPSYRLRYPEIAEDLTETLQELHNSGLCLSEESLEDLPSALAVLSAGDLRTLAKSAHLAMAGQSKGELVARLLRHSQQTSISAHFGGLGHGMSRTLLQRAKKLLGSLVRLDDAARTVFVRALMLFSIFDATTDDSSGEGGQSQLFQLLLVNIGQRVYPEYNINKRTVIFKSRDSFLRFTTALQLETDLLVAVEKGDWAGAHPIFLAAQRQYQTLSKDKAVEEDARRLPEYLQSCCGLGVMVRTLSQGVEVVQRKKDYKTAVSLLRMLLDQPLLPRYRGYWWDRLALNLEAHLKEPSQALDAVARGLADDRVRTGHRLALYQRAERICKSPSHKLASRLKEFSHPPVHEAPKTYLDGRVLHHNVPGSTVRFLSDGSNLDDDSKEITLCGVEQFVLNYYKNNGYSQGLHGEGGTMSCLFGLYLWDVLYLDVPDIFHSRFQALPLDFHTDHFYQSRQKAIDARLAELHAASNEELCDMLEEAWTTHQGKLNGCVNWERFDSLQHAQGLVQCMGGEVLAGILGRIARSPRHTRGGFPDLTLWNPETGALKISEVKGPGDRLSLKQVLWLDYLLSLGVDAEVSHVRAVGAKRLKPVKCNSTSQE